MSTISQNFVPTGSSRQMCDSRLRQRRNLRIGVQLQKWIVVFWVFKSDQKSDEQFWKVLLKVIRPIGFWLTSLAIFVDSMYVSERW